MACSSGGGGTPSQENSANQANTKIVVPSSIQTATPQFYSNQFRIKHYLQAGKLSQINTNKCFSLKDMGNSKNYLLTYNSSTWWSTVSLEYTIVNTCNSVQSGPVDVKLAGFKINGTNINDLNSYIPQTGLPWSAITPNGSDGNFIIDLQTPACEGDYCSWAQIPANGTKTITVQSSFGAAINSASIDSVTIDGNPTPPPPPAKTGTISVNIDGSDLKSICKTEADCNITISYSSPGLTVPQTFNYNPYLFPTKAVELDNLNAGMYSFSIVPSTLPGNVVQRFDPTSIQLVGGDVKQEDITFMYTPPITRGDVTVTLDKISNNDDYERLVSASNIKLVMVDETNPVYSQNSTINMGGSYTFKGLPTQDKYHIVVEGVGDALDGIYYSANNIPVVVTAGNTNKTVDYTKVSSSQLANVNFTVNGLSSESSATVNFSDDTANFKYVTNKLQSGQYQFVSGETLAVNVSNVPGYESPTTIPNPPVFTSGDLGIFTVNYVIAPASTATFDYSAPYGNGGKDVTLNIQGLQSGSEITFESNFKPVVNRCFGIAPQISTQDEKDGKYISTLTGSFSFTNSSCTLDNTNSGSANVLEGAAGVYATDPVIYSVSVDKAQLSQYHPCAANQCKDPLNGYINEGYFTDWSWWVNQYNPYTQLPVGSMNHIIYAFIGFNTAQNPTLADGSIRSLDTDGDSWGLTAITHALREYPYMHASLSFGGWTNSGYFTAPMFDSLTSDTNKINTFTQNAVKLLRATGFDGIDIDWEWWSNHENNTAPAKQKLALLQALHNALVTAGNADNKHYYLTIAVNGGENRILAMQDTVNNNNAVSDYWKQIGTLVDYISIMNYDYHGNFSKNTPSYFQADSSFANIPSTINVQGMSEGWSITDSVKTYIEQGIPSNKIIVGIPLYARTMGVAVSSNLNYGGLFQNVTGIGVDDPDNQGGSTDMIDYKCIVNPVVNPSKGCRHEIAANSIQKTTFYNIDAANSNLSLFDAYGKPALQPWGYNSGNNTFISYDDVWSTRQKADYVKQNSLAGLMFWELDEDSSQANTSLVNAGKEALAPNQ